MNSAAWLPSPRLDNKPTDFENDAISGVSVQAELTASPACLVPYPKPLADADPST